MRDINSSLPIKTGESCGKTILFKYFYSIYSRCCGSVFLTGILSYLEQFIEKSLPLYWLVFPRNDLATFTPQTSETSAASQRYQHIALQLLFSAKAQHSAAHSCRWLFRWHNCVYPEPAGSNAGVDCLLCPTFITVAIKCSTLHTTDTG